MHARVVERLSKMGEVAAAVKDAIEDKRTFLEDVVRAEIASR